MISKLDVLTQCHCDWREWGRRKEEEKRKVICHSRQALLLLAYCGLTGSVKFTGSSQREEEIPFFWSWSNSGLHLHHSFYIGAMIEFIISMIAVDHWGATLKLEKWDWFNLAITWILASSFDSWLMWAVNEPVFNWLQNSPLSFMHKSSRLPLSHGLIHEKANCRRFQQMCCSSFIMAFICFASVLESQKHTHTHTHTYTKPHQQQVAKAKKTMAIKFKGF